jgi:DinB superfamily
MPTQREWVHETLERRLDRLARTPDDLTAMIGGQSDAKLSQRPDGRNWCAKEVVCHLRDIEELVILRFHMMLAMDDPKVLVVGAPLADPTAWGIGGDVPHPLDADRWAEERQYLRNDTLHAMAAFRRRRQEVMALLGRLTPSEWQRGCLHPTFGRIDFRDWTAGMAAHDDNHLAQLGRALEGRA